MIQLNEMGKQCPLPVIEAKQTLEHCPAGEIVEVLVDNEIAVQNLLKMAGHKGLAAKSEKRRDGEFAVRIEAAGSVSTENEEVLCTPDLRKTGVVAVLSSDQMGQGDEALGRLLMKGFVYALTELEELPETVILYNSGAYLSCEGSDSLGDLKLLESQGVEILTCGTCLNHYGLSERLGVGSVTNMYEIAGRMMKAGRLVRP